MTSGSANVPPALLASLVSAAVASGALLVVADDAGVRACGGTGQSVEGLGGAPGTPSIRGVAGAHAAVSASNTVANLHRSMMRLRRAR